MTTLTHLDILEAEGIHIIREAVAELERPVLLFSGGKDSIVMLRLAEKAFYPAKIPFPVLQVDTGYDFPEVLACRDSWVNRLGLRLVVASVEQAVAFWELLEERHYRFVGTIVNRVEPLAPGRLARIAELEAIDGIDESFAARIAAAQVDHAELASRDSSRLDELADATGDALTISVPRLPRIVNDLDGLRELAPFLAD